MTEKNRNCYMIRIGRANKEIFADLFRDSCVAVGWSDINFATYANQNAEDLAEAVKKEYYYPERQIAPQVVGKKLNEVKRLFEIQKGDIILIPYGSYIRVAEAEGLFLYNKKLEHADLCNCLKVRYYLTKDNKPITIARNELTEGLQRRLRVRGSTVSNLYEFQDEIWRIIANRDYAYQTDYYLKVEEQKKAFKEILLDNIQKGRTHLQTGGIGLEKLVKELLECEGYSARVCAKTETKGTGDIDVKATRAGLFNEENVAVQIKHHQGESDVTGIQQLIDAQKTENIEYTYVFITSAQIEENAQKIADTADIKTMNGEELADWIFDNINKLSAETVRQLGVSMIPQVVS